MIGAGYREAAHAPGVRYPLPDRVHMIHNLLKSHGRAVQVLRELVPGVRVGYAPTGTPRIPATDTPADREAARKAYFGISDNPEEFELERQLVQRSRGAWSLPGRGLEALRTVSACWLAGGYEDNLPAPGLLRAEYLSGRSGAGGPERPGLGGSPLPARPAQNCLRLAHYAGRAVLGATHAL